MPTLPTLTVTDAQASRIVAAFGSVANYKAWLKDQIKYYVFRYEANQIQSQADTDIETKRTQVDGDLGSIT